MFEVGSILKCFKGYIFCFLGNSFGQYIFELFALETNLEKKRSVRLTQDLNLRQLSRSFLQKNRTYVISQNICPWMVSSVKDNFEDQGNDVG